MTRRRNIGLCGLVLALTLGGCGTAQTASPSPSNPSIFSDMASPTISATPVPTQGVTPPPTPVPKATSRPKPTPTPKPTPRPRLTPTPPPAPSIDLVGISDVKVEQAAADAGLTCQADSFGLTCDGTTALGTDLSVSSIDDASGVTDVGVTALGDTGDAQAFLNHMVDVLMGSRGPAVDSWLAANQDASVVEKTFGLYHLTYRGPLTNADLDIAPA